jgi:5'-3' exonuclease
MTHCEEEYVDMRELKHHIRNDAALVWLEEDGVYRIMQTLFVVSGCDYVSYIHGFGKKTVLQIFFQHADFITGSIGEGNLDDVANGKLNDGFKAFLRLVGAMYFKKHLSAHIPLKYHTNAKSTCITVIRRKTPSFYQ